MERQIVIPSLPGGKAFWGLADPVIALDCLVGIVAIGLLSSMFVRGAAIAGCFVLAAILGIVIHFSELNFPGIDSHRYIYHRF